MTETMAALRRAVLKKAEAYDDEEGMPLRADFIAKLTRDADRLQRAEELLRAFSLTYTGTSEDAKLHQEARDYFGESHD